MELDPCPERVDYAEEYKKLEKQLTNSILQSAHASQVGLLEQVLSKIHLSTEAPQKHKEQTLQAIRVAQILFSEMDLGITPVIASLIFYTDLEGNTTTKQNIANIYDGSVVELLTNLQQVQDLFQEGAAVMSDNFRQLLLSFTKDIRVVLILVAQRTNDMRRLRQLPKHLQQAITDECKHLYIPLTHRLGLYVIKTELEDLLLRYNDPETYFTIAQKLNEKKTIRDAYITRFIAPIKEKLKTQGLSFEIKGRTKSIHSIYNKMRKGTDFSQVYDLFAIRIILSSPLEEEETQCWKVYSIISDMYLPDPSRFRNWLSIKKANGYQSLHTTVLGPEGKFVEVQIRTERMNEIAEKGLAAHWRYKGVKGDDSLDAWLENIRDLLENTEACTQDLVDDFKLDLQDPNLFVFTPKGEVKKFPQGATILDFAFGIHTQVGSKCIGALVNEKHVSFKYQLQNGDKISIKTSSAQKPKSEWLNLVVTSRAKTKLKQALRDLLHKDVLLGKEILFRRFKNWKLEISENMLAKHARKLNQKSLHDIYLSIYRESLDPRQVRDTLYPIEEEEENSSSTQNTASFTLAVKQSPTESEQDPLIIDKHLKNIQYTLSKCCRPIFGDLVFGFVTTIGGIKVHKSNCPNAPQLRKRFPYRIIPAQWANNTGKHYLSSLFISGNDKLGILGSISSLLNSEFKISIHSISIDSKDGIFQGSITIPVEDTTTLNRIIKRIETIKGVNNVSRLNN